MEKGLQGVQFHELAKLRRYPSTNCVVRQIPGNNPSSNLEPEALINDVQNIQTSVSPTSSSVFATIFCHRLLHYNGMLFLSQKKEELIATYTKLRLDKFPICMGIGPINLFPWRSLQKNWTFGVNKQYWISIVISKPHLPRPLQYKEHGRFHIHICRALTSMDRGHFIKKNLVQNAWEFIAYRVSRCSRLPMECGIGPVKLL